MTSIDTNDRRHVLRTGVGAILIASAASVLPGCATYAPFSMTEAIRRLLLRSSENAFARLTEADGFWDEQVARIGLGEMLGTRGDVLSRILTSAVFKDRMEDAFADIAIEGAYRAAPVVTDAVQVIGLENARDLVAGGPRAATVALRGEVGDRLVRAMLPELDEAIRISSDPLVAQLVEAAVGTDVGAISRELAAAIDDAIWLAIGDEEAAIRRDPTATRDSVLIDVFGGSAA